MSSQSLERIVREASAEGDHEKIAKIVHQLCHDYAYAVHQPHARNGGLIGLAAAAIALGSVRVSIDEDLPLANQTFRRRLLST